MSALPPTSYPGSFWAGRNYPGLRGCSPPSSKVPQKVGPGRGYNRDYGRFILIWMLTFPNGLTYEKSRFAKPMGNGKEFSHAGKGFVQSNDTTMKI